MTIASHAQTLPSTVVRPTQHTINPETQAFVALGKEKEWEVAVLGRAPMLAEPVRLGDWLLMPVEEDASPMPTRAIERVQAIYAAGLRPQGFVVVHEAPLLLTTPEGRHAKAWQFPSLSPDAKSALKAAAGTLGVVAVGIGAVTGIAALAVAALSVAAVLAVPVFLLAGMTLIDPILVVVTEDGYWVEIDRWSNEA